MILERVVILEMIMILGVAIALEAATGRMVVHVVRQGEPMHWIECAQREERSAVGVQVAAVDIECPQQGAVEEQPVVAAPTEVQIGTL